MVLAILHGALALLFLWYGHWTGAAILIVSSAYFESTRADR